MRAELELADSVAHRLANIEEVVAVALGGSWAQEEARVGSDLDLGIYYRSEQPPSVDALRLLAQDMDERHPPDLVTEFGEWGPWINGGGWLRIDGNRVDWLYRDLDRVRSTIEDCLDGRISCHYQPGHPHGFHNHIYMGEVHYCLPLHDQEGKLSELKALAAVYPPKLKRALIRRYLWEADFALYTARSSAERGEVFYVAGCLFRCVACLVQVLFALNERYFVNEKGSVRAVDSFERRPARFSEIVENILGQLGSKPGRLRSSIARGQRLVSSVQEICAGASREDGA